MDEDYLAKEHTKNREIDMDELNALLGINLNTTNSSRKVLWEYFVKIKVF